MFFFLLVCGDGECSNKRESCITCPKDCCGLIFPVEATAGIVLFCIIIPIIIITAIIGVRITVTLGG